jgi:hypothetical protein
LNDRSPFTGCNLTAWHRASPDLSVGPSDGSTSSDASSWPTLDR